MPLLAFLVIAIIAFALLNIAPLVVIGLFLLAFAALNMLEKGQVD